jgi:uncharacterized protein HemX
MSEDKQNSSEITEKDRNQTNQNAPKSNPKVVKSNSNGVAVAIAMLFGIAGIGIGGYSLYLNYTVDKSSEVKTKVTTLNDQLERLDRNVTHVKASEATLSQSVDKIQNRDQQIKSSVNQMLGAYEGKLDVLKQSVTQVQNTYLLPQSELREQIQLVNINAAQIYLNLADQYIKVTGDKSAGIALAQKAEQSLMVLGASANEQVSKIRIAISALKSNRYNGLKDEVAKLAQLEKISTGLALKVPGEANKIANDEPKKDTSWKDGLDASWDRLRSLVTVSQLNDTESALLNSRVRGQLIMTLQFNVEQAKIAMLRGDEQMYNSSMASAHDLVIKYFKENGQYSQWIRLASSVNFPESISNVAALDSAIESVDKLSKHFLQDNNNLPQADMTKGAK